MLCLHVAVGVVRNAAGEVLISRRGANVHQGGLWEFPGGKVENGETVFEALQRELREELNISVQQATPLIQIHHDYGDCRVFLDVWEVGTFAGTVLALEGQPLQWTAPQNLDAAVFPAANRPIITAVKLPRYYAIIEGRDCDVVLSDFQRIVQCGVKLLQFRLKGLSAAERSAFLADALPICWQFGITVLLNSSIANAQLFEADGIHLTTKDLLALERRPGDFEWVAASCHNLQELEHAQRIGVDFAVLAPVAATATHADTAPLGWERFSACVAEVNIPVFALGGMLKQHAAQAFAAGAQGIAGIRLFRDQ